MVLKVFPLASAITDEEIDPQALDRAAHILGSPDSVMHGAVRELHPDRLPDLNDGAQLDFFPVHSHGSKRIKRTIADPAAVRMNREAVADPAALDAGEIDDSPVPELPCAFDIESLAVSGAHHRDDLV